MASLQRAEPDHSENKGTFGADMFVGICKLTSINSPNSLDVTKKKLLVAPRIATGGSGPGIATRSKDATRRNVLWPLRLRKDCVTLLQTQLAARPCSCAPQHN